MQEYELTVLIHPDLETDLEKPLTVLRDIVASNGGKIKSEDSWGKKKLAYKIAKQNFAVYVALAVELPASAPQKISNILNITDGVLRYLLVKIDDKEKAKLEASKHASNDQSEE